MVMGRPVRSPGSNVFTRQDFDDFIHSLQTDTDPHIIVVSPDPLDIDLNSDPHGILPSEE